MDYAHLTAPCGLDCFNCPMYAARENEKLRAMIAQRLDISPEKARCPGCRAQGGIMDFFGWTEPCKVWRCIEPKGLHNCGECDDFPCDHLHPYADLAAERPHNTKVFNLALIEKWASRPGPRKRRGASRRPISRASSNSERPRRPKKTPPALNGPRGLAIRSPD